ncbi:gluconate 5-dehydrogenase [Rubrobacter xylanophilus]|uniref:Gluconate 5-dehydrogenase n=1 Tax=Rubrobacter xylanophilus TaxID=49319 RepID=A0A510HIM4_9ACTN|nr:SDR family oxidoreductase [Rubrobacter xylanophilus]BBL79768.1 gluconate 5-dehydrogenase [Rubrobacter xylanophilus]
MAEALADAGAAVVLCSRRVEACEEVRAGIEGRGGRALALECDVTDPEQVEEVVEEAVGGFGAVDVLVNNAGATWGAPPLEMPPERVERVMQVNIRGTFLMSRSVARRMIERGSGGAIVSVASVAGLLRGRPGYMQAVGYGASRGTVISMTRDPATGFARHGITVNALAPGWFPTRMSGPLIERHEKEMLEHIPLKRFGEPEDIKCGVLPLASRAGAYITGLDHRRWRRTERLVRRAVETPGEDRIRVCLPAGGPTMQWW